MLFKKIHLYCKNIYDKTINNYLIKKRIKICGNMRDRLINDNFTIICNTCVGGNIYHDLGLRFNTPLINSIIDIDSYYSLLLNLRLYLDSTIEVKECEDGIHGRLLDKIDVFFPHDHTKDFIEERWNRRKKRINYANIFIIVVDQKNYYNGEHMSLELLNKFFSLPFNRLIVITNDKNKAEMNNKKIVYLKHYSSNLMFYPGKIDKKSGKRIYEKYFDVVKWLNSI